MEFQSTLPTRGSDRQILLPSMHVYISIHAPHEGERRNLTGLSNTIFRFQSTLPTRGSDRLDIYTARHAGYFNPRSPRGGATYDKNKRRCGVKISIHAPHEGERHKVQRPPRRGRVISIHAPHEGERRDGRQPSSRQRGISIHAPHEGERLH